MDHPIKLHTEVVIDGAHCLVGYKGACQRVHGHSWRIRVWIRGYSSQLNDLGILFDFTNIKSLKDLYDHQYLNEVKPFDRINPTAENLALTIYNKLVESGCKQQNSLHPDLTYAKLEFVVRVYETSIGKECWAQTGDWDENS
jgi:6-pyruvoyltetrahydropterin/6-carboxytetrahydropterin synthase